MTELAAKQIQRFGKPVRNERSLAAAEAELLAERRYWALKVAATRSRVEAVKRRRGGHRRHVEGEGEPGRARPPAPGRDGKQKLIDKQRGLLPPIAEKQQGATQQASLLPSLAAMRAPGGGTIAQRNVLQLLGAKS